MTTRELFKAYCKTYKLSNMYFDRYIKCTSKSGKERNRKLWKEYQEISNNLWEEYKVSSEEQNARIKELIALSKAL